MKRIKRLILVMLMLFSFVSLTGCGNGATVNTTLTVNADYSGVRTMQMVFAQTTFDQYFTGTIDDLNNTITGSIPDGMTYDYSESNGNYYYQFYINFSSVEDYNAKVQAIIGEDNVAEINCPDSVWVSGIYVNETYTSTDLLQWLSDALVNNGQLSENYVSNLFGTGDTKVEYSGKEISAYTRISVDEIEYQRINSINLYTDVKDLAHFDRNIEFNIPAESMNNKGAEIDAALNDNKPSNATLQKEEIDGNTVYTYCVENVTVDELDGFMKAIFGEENTSAVSENVDDYFSPFSFNAFIEEEFSLTDYVVGDTSTRVNYYVKSNVPEMEYQLRNPILDFTYNVYGDVGDVVTDYELLGEYFYSGYDNAGFISVPLLLQKNYRVKAADATLDKGLFGDWTRTIGFTLETVPSEDEIALLQNKVQARFFGAKENEEAVTEDTAEDIDAETVESDEPEALVENTDESDSVKDVIEEKNVSKISIKTEPEFVFTIEQKGSLDELQKETTEIFAQDNYTTYTCENGLLKTKRLASIEENLNLGNFVDNKTEDYQLNYSAKLGSGAQIIDCNFEDEDMRFENGKLNVSTNSNWIRLTVTYKYTDMWIIGFVIFVLVFIVLLIVSLKLSGLLKFDAIIGKIKSVSKPKNKMVANETAEKFCTKCGKANPSTGKFCKYCGEKMGE